MKKQDTPEKKKKKGKPIYIDDGRQIADMSALDRANKRPSRGDTSRPPRASVREQLGTFFSAMRMMLLPMLFAMLAISLAFLLLWLAAR